MRDDTATLLYAAGSTDTRERANSGMPVLDSWYARAYYPFDLALGIPHQMRRTGSVLFVIFYIWATVAVAGERSSRIVHRIYHSGGPATHQINSPGQHFGGELPNFGHATKAKLHIASFSLEFFHAPQITVRQFQALPDVEYSSSDGSKVHSSRAPPALI
jgi:hypothetical protein